MITKEINYGKFEDIQKECIKELAPKIHKEFVNTLMYLRDDLKARPQDVFDLGQSMLLTLVINGMECLHNAFATGYDERIEDMMQFNKQLLNGYAQINEGIKVDNE